MTAGSTTADTRSLSVVTLTYNNFTDRRTTLPVLFEALERQDLPEGTELVVVDDGSTDRTPAYVERAGGELDGFDVTLVETEHTGNQCENRNHGIEAADGDLLFLLDDDAIPLHDDAMRNALDAWKPGTFCCGARRFWSPPEWDTERVAARLRGEADEPITEWAHLPRGAIKRRTGSRSLQEYTFIEHFGVVSKAAVEGVGMLDEEYTEWGHGDTDLMLRLLLDGIGFVNLHDIVRTLHLSGPLGFPRGSENTNSEVFHRKLAEYGVDFNVTRLYEAPSGVHSDVLMPREPDGDPTLTDHTVDITRPGTRRTEVPITNVGVTDAESVAAANRSVSVVIPTYNAYRNRDGAIEAVLDALDQQVGIDLEIVVADGGSDDGTVQSLERFTAGSQLDVEFIQVDGEPTNRSLARNAGARAASSDLLVFLDDDTVPLSTAALATVARLHEPGTYLAGARTYWNSAYDPVATVTEAVGNADFEVLVEDAVLPRGIRRRDGYRSLRSYSRIGRFGAIAAHDFAAVDGFDAERMDGWGLENEDLMWRLHEADVAFRSLYDDVSVLHVNHPITDRDFNSRERLVERHARRERTVGKRFKLNHLYGVYENDGREVVQPLDRQVTDA